MLSAGLHTVTGENKKFILIGQIVLLDIRVSCDNLVFGRELSALLELKVTNGTGQSEVTVDAAKVDKATSGCDSVLFAYRNALVLLPTRGLCCYSLSIWGLWSMDRGFARPLMPRTPRESPALALGEMLVFDCKIVRWLSQGQNAPRRVCCRLLS